MEFTDKDKYLEAIKKELHHNPDGFRADTISKDSELRKSVDDLHYGECGVDNPNAIEYYKQAVAVETISHTDELTRQRGIKM